jgi:cytochrome o ubiquinol oxidase subunit II
MQHRRYARPRASDRGAPHLNLSQPPPGSGALRRIARLLFVGAAAVLLASCRMAGVLDPQGPVGAQELLLMVNTTEIMLVVVIPVILLTLWFAFWYRAGNDRANHSPEWDYEGGVELVIWSIPALVVLLLGGVEWIGSHQLDPRAPIQSDKKPIQVDVVSLDWKWLFIYPDQQIATVNQLVVPAGTPVNFRLTSATVMNAFFVPQLGTMIYTMGGMASRLNLMADKPGEYPGVSANFSGAGFADMRFVVKAVAPGEFDGWVQQAKGAGAALDDKAYAELAKPSHAVPPATYKAADPKLFDRIIEMTTNPAEKTRAEDGAWCPPTPQAGAVEAAAKPQTGG